MPTVTKSLGEGTQSVLLTVAILERLANQPGPVGISDIAREIGTSKSRIFRHLQTLMECDYIASRGDGEYQIGNRLVSFCRTISERYDLVSLASVIMAELQERLGHSVIVSRVDSSGVHVLKSLSGASPIQVGIRPGTVLPFDSSAQGKVALAFLAPGHLAAGTPAALAYAALTDVQKAELQAVQQQGWASAQMRQGLRGLAAPVLDVSGAIVATLAILDTAADMGDDYARSKIPALVEAAGRLSQKLAVSSSPSA